MVGSATIHAHGADVINRRRWANGWPRCSDERLGGGKDEGVDRDPPTSALMAGMPAAMRDFRVMSWRFGTAPALLHHPRWSTNPLGGALHGTTTQISSRSSILPCFAARDGSWSRRPGFPAGGLLISTFAVSEEFQPSSAAPPSWGHPKSQAALLDHLRHRHHDPLPG